MLWSFVSLKYWSAECLGSLFKCLSCKDSSSGRGRGPVLNFKIMMKSWVSSLECQGTTWVLSGVLTGINQNVMLLRQSTYLYWGYAGHAFVVGELSLWRYALLAVFVCILQI